MIPTLALLLEAPLCAMRDVLHVACPTCGLTRSFAHLLHGDFAQAFHLHPMGPGLVAELALLSGVMIQARARGRDPELRGGRWLLLNVVLFLGVWGVRAATGTLPA